MGKNFDMRNSTWSALAQVELLYLFLKKVMKEMKGKEQLVNEKKEKYHFQSL